MNAKRYWVDPRLLVDILEDDPERGLKAAELLEAHRKDLLMLTPGSYMALGPAFEGRKEMQDMFLANLGVTVGMEPQFEMLQQGYAAYCAYCKDHPRMKRNNGVLDSFAVGALALKADGLLTRQGDLYRTYMPSLRVIEP